MLGVTLRYFTSCLCQSPAQYLQSLGFYEIFYHVFKCFIKIFVQNFYSCVFDCRLNMTALPLCQDIKPPLHSMVDQSNMDGICHGEMSKANYDFEEMDNICRSIALADCNNIKPAIFVTGPEAWPAHLQLKVGKTFKLFLI